VLTEIRVRDLAVIRDVTLSLKPGLNVLTGETGAGKSMLVDALALLLGERASSDLVRPGADRCVVEAAFDVAGLTELTQVANDTGLDLADDLLAVRRDINSDGRNRAWANGSPTTVSALATVGRHLVDLHGQHEAQSLLKGGSQRDILDAFGGNAGDIEKIRSMFGQVSELRTRAAELAARRDDVKKRADYLRHVAQEIAGVDPKPGEYEELEVENRKLANVEDLTVHAERLAELLDGEEGAAAGTLGRALKELSSIERIDGTVVMWQELLDAALANVEELAHGVREYASTIELDPERLSAVERRRDLLYRLKQKYGPAIEDVLRTGEQAQQELDLLDTADTDIGKIGEQLARAESDLEAAAGRLSERRKKAGAKLDKAVNKLLPGLGMTSGKFEVQLRPAERINASGGDVVTFLVTLNEGIEPRPLATVASGGELSRLMLALKVVLARHDSIPTLVFDEVDQGIGGEVAVKVSQALAEVAESRQVLIITHLPQIAARAQHHLRVEKHQRNGLPSTAVLVLEGEKRVEEIARMLGDGADPVANQHAREMIGRAAGI
jgi:DNA repair protein RecN (Recombination protein N)